MLAPLVPELQQIKRELLMNYANETAVAQVAKACVAVTGGVFEFEGQSVVTHLFCMVDVAERLQGRKTLHGIVET